MLSNGHSEENANSKKRSIVEWCRALTKGLIDAPMEPRCAEANWYAGLAIAPGLTGPSDAVEFTKQISRLHSALAGSGQTERKSRSASPVLVPASRTTRREAADAGISC